MIRNLLAMLTIVFGVATIIALFSQRLRRNRSFWFFFFGVNITPLLLLRIESHWLYVNGPLVILALFCLFWIVRPRRRPASFNIALTLLTSLWLIFNFLVLQNSYSYLFSNLNFFVKHPLYLCSMILTPLAPLLSCFLLLLFQLLLRRGPFEPSLVSMKREIRTQRFCPHCRALADPDAVFCTKCGFEIKD